MHLLLCFFTTSSSQLFISGDGKFTSSITVFLSIDITMDAVILVDIFFHAHNFHCIARRTDHSDVVESNCKQWMKVLDVLSSLPVDFVVGAFCGWEFFSLVRAIRLLRLARLFDYLDVVKRCFGRRNIEFWPWQSRLALLLVSTVTVMHCVACGWYYIGYAEERAGNYSWLTRERELALHINAPFDLFRAYVRSIYFAFVVLTMTGYGDIKAFTNVESLFAGLLMLVGLFLYSASIGAITSMLRNWMAPKQEQQQYTEDLYRFLRLHRLSLGDSLCHEIRQYCDYHWRKHHGIQVNELLATMPKPLQDDLACSFYSELILGNGLFTNCSFSFVKYIASSFIYESFIPGHRIVRAGDVAREIFLFNLGRAEVLSKDMSTTIGFVSEGMFYGEREFILALPRAYNLRTMTFCDVCILYAESFQIALRKFPADLVRLRENSALLLRKYQLENDVLFKNLRSPKVQAVLSLKYAPFVHLYKTIDSLSRFRFVWDMVLVVFTLYVSFIVPLRLAFASPAVGSEHAYYWEYAIDVTYIVDIYLQLFRFDFVDVNGNVVSDPEEIAALYMSDGFFFTDVLASLPSEVFALVAPGDHTLRAFLRINKLLRLSCLPGCFARLRHRLLLSNLNIPINAVNLAQLIALVFAIAHWLGCGFFLLARLQGGLREGVVTWISEGELVDSDLYTQYLHSFYWAFSTITIVAFGDIVPVTTLGTIYAILTTTCSAVLVAALIGNISNLLSNLDKDKAALSAMISRVDKLALRSHLPSALLMRAHQYCHHMYATQRGVDEQRLITQLPRSVCRLISTNRFLSYIKDQLYFSFLEHNVLCALSQVLAREVFVPDDFIMLAGETGRALYIVKHGFVRIHSCVPCNGYNISPTRLTSTLNDSVKSTETRSIRLDEGNLLGDVSFFLPLLRTASIQATGFCEFLVLKKEDFDVILAAFPHHVRRMEALARFEYEENQYVQECMTANFNKYPKLHKVLGFDRLNFPPPPPSPPPPPPLVSRYADLFRRPLTTVVFSPRNAGVQVWSMLMLALTYYCLWITPLRVCFVTEHVAMGSMIKADWIIDVFFVVDMYLNAYHIGYVDHVLNTIVFDSTLIAKRYFSSRRFVVDLIASIPLDLICLALAMDSERLPDSIVYFRLNKMYRAVILVDISKQLRICWRQLSRFFQSVFRRKKTFANHSFGNNTSSTVFSAGSLRILAYLSVFLLVGHWMGCIWFFVGVQSYESSIPISNWLSFDGLYLPEATSFRKYVRSFYYVITAMTTVGFGGIKHINNEETGFVLALILVSVAMYSGLVSTVESVCSETDKDTSRFQLQLKRDRAYMKERHLPESLQQRIIKHVSLQWTSSTREEEKQVLAGLPQNLQMDVMFFVHGNIFNKVTLFENCVEGFTKSIAMVLERQIYLPNDVIRAAYTIRSDLFLISSGIIAFNFEDTTLFNLFTGDFFGEDSFIQSPQGISTSGDFVALNRCDVATLSRRAFLEITAYFPKYKQSLIWKMEAKTSTRFDSLKTRYIMLQSYLLLCSYDVAFIILL